MRELIEFPATKIEPDYISIHHLACAQGRLPRSLIPSGKPSPRQVEDDKHVHAKYERDVSRLDAGQPVSRGGRRGE